MKSSHLHIAPALHNAQAIWQRLSLRVLEKQTESSSQFSIALPGGSSLMALLEALPSQQALNQFGHLAIFSLDERKVSFESPESNMGSLVRGLRQTFTLRHEKQATNLHFFPCFESAPLLSLHQAQAAYQKKFLEVTGGRLDLAVVGIGPDGHIASLFPGKKWQSDEPEESMLIINDSPKPPLERISLSLSKIAQSRSVWVYTFGESKAEAIARACGGDQSLPLGALLAAAPHAELFVDPDAASQL